MHHPLFYACEASDGVHAGSSRYGVVAIFCGCLVEGRRLTALGDGRQRHKWVGVSEVVGANLAGADSDVVGPINIDSVERPPCST